MLGFPTRPTTTCHKPQCQQLQTQTRRDRQWDTFSRCLTCCSLPILLSAFPSHQFFSNLSSALAFPPTLVFGIFSCSFLRHHMMSDTFQTQPVHTSEMGVAKIYLYLGLSDTSVAMTLSKSNKVPYRKSKIKLVSSYPQIGLFMTENRKTISVLQSLPLQH